MTYKRDDTSKDKAIWMLLLDAIDSLIDSLDMLIDRRHRIAARVFRDVVEECDLALYFSYDVEASRDNLLKWYDNKIIPNRIVRKYIKNQISPEIAEKKVEFYRMLSKITHRTYRTLAYGYLLGRDEYIAYDGAAKTRMLVTPHTLAMYYALLGFMIKLVIDMIVTTKLLPNRTIEIIWAQSLDEETVPRRFMTPQEVYERYLKSREVKRSDYA
jgi:hypothetical protein